MRKCTQKYTKMHIDILDLLRTAHTFFFLCTLTYIRYIQYKHTYCVCVCVCVCVCFNSLVYETLHSVERDFLQANPRFSTWHQSTQLSRAEAEKSHKLSAVDFFPIFV